MCHLGVTVYRHFGFSELWCFSEKRIISFLTALCPFFFVGLKLSSVIHALYFLWIVKSKNGICWFISSNDFRNNAIGFYGFISWYFDTLIFFLLLFYLNRGDNGNLLDKSHKANFEKVFPEKKAYYNTLISQKRKNSCKFRMHNSHLKKSVKI